MRRAAADRPNRKIPPIDSCHPADGRAKISSDHRFVDVSSMFSRKRSLRRATHPTRERSIFQRRSVSVLSTRCLPYASQLSPRSSRSSRRRRIEKSSSRILRAKRELRLSSRSTWRFTVCRECPRHSAGAVYPQKLHRDLETPSSLDIHFTTR